MRRAIWHLVVAATATVMAPWASGVIAPLPEPRQVQADTYADGGHPDQPALYALLADVAEWSGGDEAGAAVADWDMILEDPSAFRGAAVLVEGADAGQRKRMGLVRRQRPWGGAVTQRGVVVRGDLQTAEGALPVVVWLFDPSDEAGRGVDHGQQVRVVGRFLGLWDDRDAHGQARTYPVVVARSLRVLDTGRATGPGWASSALLWVFVAAALLVVWRASRWFVRRDVVAERQARRNRVVNRGDDEETNDEAELPDEPDAALDELARRRGVDQ